MSGTGSGRHSSIATQQAARAFTRRLVLQGALAGGGLAAVAPAYIGRALAASGTLNWLTWEDFAPKPLIDKFTADTGIAVTVTTYVSNEELLTRLRAGGHAADLVSPTATWVGRHVDAGTLQPIDEGRLKNLGNLLPELHGQMELLGAKRDGKTFGLPWDWVTEALAYNPEAAPLAYGSASYGDLWNPKYAGRVTVRARSAMLGLGLWLEARGELPAGTMRQAYDDPEIFKLGYGKAADYIIAHKTQIKQFWSGTADHQSAFLQNGVVLGQTWDSPIFGMQREGNPIAFVAPKEGALAWIDTAALPKGAKNLDQAYAFIDWMLLPENAGLMIDNTGYNSATKGAADFASDAYSRFFKAAFPDDALSRLWAQGEEKPWFLAARQELTDKIQAA